MKSNFEFSANRPYIFAVFIVMIGSFFVSNHIQNEAAETLTHTLTTVADDTQTALRVWSDRQQDNAVAVAEIPQLVEDAVALQRRARDGKLGPQDPLHDQIRGDINFAVTRMGYLGFFIIAPDGTTLSSMRDSNISGQNIIAANQPTLFQAVLDGATKITPPMPTDVPVAGPDGSVVANAATMFVLSPIRGATGKVVAVLSLRINPYLEFSAIFARGRTGLSGETYAFNHDGIMISESRFIDQLQTIGLLQNAKFSTLNVAIRDPGQELEPNTEQPENQANWPLTRMAKSALAGNTDVELDPYRDYRGIDVIGAWRWDEKINIGYATEIDSSEAYAVATKSLLIHSFLSAAVIALIIAFGVQQARIRKRNALQEAALEAAKEKAEKANRAKMEFLSAMSHDLRTPLNAIIGFSQVLRNEQPFRLNSGYQKQLGYIERGGEMLRRMLNEILEYATIDIGEVTYDFESVKPADLVEDCISMAIKDADKRGITITQETDFSTLPEVKTDFTRACQVLGNLLSNAVKYNRPEGEVRLKGYRDDGYIRIEVQDTGLGLTDAQMEKLWEPFNRLGAEESKVEGTGIGLAFSKVLIEALGGQIGANSVVGEGSCFWFTLPIARIVEMGAEDDSPDRAIPAEQSSKELAILAGKQILYVEDVAINRELMKSMLKPLGGNALACAETGGEGLSILSDKQFDLLLVDLQLPDMTGFEWNQKRLKAGLAEHAHLVAVSADLTPESRQRALSSGFDGFIEKPVKLDDLKEVFGSLVKQH